jgi:hypothetical protein
MGSRIDSGDDLASYLWERSDVAIPAPGEAVYLGSALAAVVRHRNMDSTSWLVTETHFPQMDELSGIVSLSVGKLVAHESGKIGPTAHARRTYTRALKSLDAARVTASIRATNSLGRIRKYDISFPVKSVVDTSGEVLIASNVTKERQLVGATHTALQSSEHRTGAPQALVYHAGPKGVAAPSHSSMVHPVVMADSVSTAPPIAGAADTGLATQ